MKIKHLIAALVACAGAMLAATSSNAQSLTIVAGSTCAGATSATYTPGGAPITISVCASAPVATCGATLQFASANAGENDRFQIASRTRGASFDTDNNATYTFGANTITNPVSVQDFGATNGVAVPAASGVVVATFTVAPQLTATNNSYVVTLGGLSSLTSTATDCASAAESSSNPTFTFNKAATPSTAVFSIGNVTVTEAGAAANAVVTCTGAFASNTVTPVTVAFSTTNAAGNFTTSASPVSFAACGTTQNIVVTPRVDDATVQGTVTGTIVLGAITTDVGATISNGTSTVTVNDNDTPPVFSLAKAGACAEPATNCTFTITRDSGVATATTVNFAVSGTATRSTTGLAGSGDYYLALTACAPANVIAGTSVSHPNASPLVVNMCVLDDLAVEGTEAATLTLTANPPTYTVGTAAQTQNIADDDSPQTVSVAVSGSPATESGGVLTYTFTRAGGSAAAQAATLAVNITPPAASGRYSTTCTSPQTFAAATATKTCTVTGINDALLNGNVNVVVGVAAPTVASDYTVGAPATATGVIADDEVGVSVAAVSGVITEGGLATFTISCTGVATTSVPFTLTGTVGTDVVGGATSPIALVCGTPQTVTVQTAQNTISGDGRSLTLTLGTPTGGNAALVPGQSASTVAVLDDDGPKIVPTMGMLGLGLMSLMLAGLAAFQRRRSMK